MKQKLWQTAKNLEDKLTGHKKKRWSFTGAVGLCYLVRVWATGGFHVVSYCLGIYLLNLLLAFLTPLEGDIEDELEDCPVLPVYDSEEYRPFLRKLNETKFWRNVTLAVIVCNLCSFVPLLDIPVFWPLLAFYFFVLFFAMMRKQIAHMFKHKYLPFDIGKKKYSN